MTAAEPTAPPLAFQCFGPFAVRLGGAPLPRLRSAKGYWLLALLTMRSGCAVERGWLAGLFWPEVLESQAAAHLRRSLTDLRQALGAEARRLQSPAPRTLCLDLAGCTVDVFAFDAAIARGDERSLERAVALYRGPLLEGWTEEWAFQERQTREQAYLWALERLAALAEERGDVGAAQRHLERVVAVDPLRESAHRALMQALAAGGNYAAATELYRDLRLRLHQELNAAPDPETSALFRQIRSEAQRRTQAAALRRSALASGPPVNLRPRSVPAERSCCLPRPATPLLGRDRERAAVGELLRREEVHLVTLTGAGGSGKTHLGLQIAADRIDQFPDGVFFVNLAPIRQPDLVTTTIAQVLGVRETDHPSLRESLIAWLHAKQLLLVLDNFEQVIDAGPLLAELLEWCPQLKLLITSRERLRLRAEHEFPVLPLALPDRARAPSLEALSQFAAVELFVQRAQAVRPDFALNAEMATAVVEICHRLDGLPLAIELAAARCKLLSPPALLARLESRLALLAGGIRDLPARQQTLRSAIAWSYDLLSEAEQRLFRRLSVFVGGGSLSAVAVIGGVEGEVEGDLLERMGSLVDKNLLRWEELGEPEPRVGMLETIREYGLERLAESGEEEVVRRQHAACFVRFAEETRVKLFGADEAVWLAQFEREHNNLRAALDWLTEHGEAEAGLWLAAGLWRFWEVRGYWSEGRERLVDLLALTGAAARTVARAQALNAVALLAWRQSDLQAARALHEESLAICQELGDRHGIARSLSGLGLVVRGQGDYAAARRLFEEALAISRALGNQGRQAANLHWLGYVAVAEGNYAGAKTFFEEALAIGQEPGHRGGASFRVLGELALMQGDYAAARQIFEDVLRTARELKDKLNSARCLKGLGDVAQGQGDCETAQAFYAESLALCGELGFKPGIAWLLQEFAGRAAARGQPERAARLLGAADPLLDTLGDRFEPTLWLPSDRNVSAVRARLSEKAFAAAWAAGRAMTLDEAITVALEDGSASPDLRSRRRRLPAAERLLDL
jgi:predicted ATPase/DNA-binding SARP family transcriptional activator